MSLQDTPRESLGDAIGSIRSANQHSSTKVALTHTVRGFNLVEESLAQLRRAVDELQEEVAQLKARR